jgi:hypothetical protein
MRLFLLLIAAAGCEGPAATPPADFAVVSDQSSGLPMVILTSDSTTWSAGFVGPGMPTIGPYEVVTDQQAMHAGKPTRRLRFLGSDGGTADWPGIIIVAKAWNVSSYAGMRIRMTLPGRTDSVVNGAAPWVRIDDSNKQPVRLLTMQPGRTLTGTQDFTDYVDVFDVPADGVSAVFGTILDRDGTLWSGVATFELVDDTVPVSPYAM